jgi:hypothetical protein
MDSGENGRKTTKEWEEYILRQRYPGMRTRNTNRVVYKEFVRAPMKTMPPA